MLVAQFSSMIAIHIQSSFSVRYSKTLGKFCYESNYICNFIFEHKDYNSFRLQSYDFFLTFANNSSKKYIFD